MNGAAEEARECRSPGALSLWLPPVLYLAAIWLASSQQAPTTLPPGGWDKLVHALAYAGLGALLGRAFGGSGVGPPAALALAVLTASLYGASDEWHQSFVPNRFADAGDWLADTVGACAGAVVWLSLRVVRSRASLR